MEAQKSKIIYFKSQTSGKAMNSAIAALALSKAAQTVSQIIEKSDVKRECPKCICQWFSNQNPTSRGNPFTRIKKGTALWSLIQWGHILGFPKMLWLFALEAGQGRLGVL